MGRLAVLDRERCKPKDCGLPCVKYCPEVRNRVEAIKLDESGKFVVVSENLCSGCGICVKKCPFKALSVVNLPQELDVECSHRYGLNAFKLFRLPTPRDGTVTGLIGRNGIGKSTALKILSGEIKPNLGRFTDPPEWEEVIRAYRGSTLQNYFTALSEQRLKVVSKPQHVDLIPRYVNEEVSELLSRIDERGALNWMKELLSLEEVWERTTSVLSGGELQRVAVAAALCRNADVYIFDEPSSHLDVHQRLMVARAIRTLIREDKTVLLAEHDLALLDYLSDHICVFYGKPGVYGVVSRPHGVRVGVNIYLDGFLPDENMRFRAEPIRFHVKPPRDESKVGRILEWDAMRKSYDEFTLKVGPGRVQGGEVVGMLGPNGIGKTTLVKMLAGFEEPDEGYVPTEGLKISYKPQYISGEYRGTVESILKEAAGPRYMEEGFRGKVLSSLNLIDFLDRDVEGLSGGELQRVAIAACLFRDADVYFLDEPSAYLDVEERLGMTRLVRDVAEEREAFAFVVEHDLIAQDFVADKLMVFTGRPGVEGYANPPTDLRSGMNVFLAEMDVTFRRDPSSGRPRVNKPDSRVDRSQKEVGEYYYVPPG
ncbi:MAG: ribosome biogenesis/translation initiation ATPase RLI [Candidatus Bathyarchaeia archaeon]